MRAILAAALGLVALLPKTAQAADYLYTFTGVVTYANNIDATFVYANEGDPFTFSVLIKDTLSTVTYAYGPDGSSAVGGPDTTPGTFFPIDRIVDVNGANTPGDDFTPLQTGFNTNENYSGSVVKNLGDKSLTIDMNYERFIPSPPGCQERCAGERTTHFLNVQVFSDAFSLPDFRETGSFALNPPSSGYLGDTYSTYLHFGDSYEIAVSNLTVTRLAGAVPETSTWLMMIAGIGFAGAALRRRPSPRPAYSRA